jgi:hypothetical protein
VNAAPAVAEAERLLTGPLTDRELGVVIARAVHPTASLAQLAAVCRMSKATYTGVWRRLTSQHNPPTPEGVPA